MKPTGHARFETPIGACGIAWGGHGVTKVSLPGEERREPRCTPAPPEIRLAIAGIVAVLRGERRDLSSLRLDMEGVEDFRRRVYEAARGVPSGQTVTYGELARRVGEPSGGQAVGVAMARNPWPVIVPCHRVLPADGSLGGFSAPGGVAIKRLMLEIEGAPEAGGPMLFADERLATAAG